MQFLNTLIDLWVRLLMKLPIDPFLKEKLSFGRLGSRVIEFGTEEFEQFYSAGSFLNLDAVQGEPIDAQTILEGIRKDVEPRGEEEDDSTQ
ncbi:hypothetical protein ACQFX9_14290 [Aliinostoc sp. HNIBRCY26]|uniref:hypothetical protein n=1 Tax=Aliinostoc sp. HNIBRCY26 TaxID=3418997 RepID=UPI003CFFA8F1